MTVAGRRSVISLRGLGDLGRPPLLTTARASISSVSSGSSRYSLRRMTWESTFARFDPKVAREALFLTGIGFPHAEYVSVRAARRVTDDHHAS
jgi:hypothetical protein